MRIRYTETSILEAYDVETVVSGRRDPDNPDKYVDVRNDLFIYAHGLSSEDGGDYWGEFDCNKATTFEEARMVSRKFLDDLMVNGFVDISTKEKCEWYHLTLW